MSPVPSFLFPFFFLGPLSKRNERMLISMHRGSRGWLAWAARPSCNAFIMRHLRSFRAHDPDTLPDDRTGVRRRPLFLNFTPRRPSITFSLSLSLILRFCSTAARERTRGPCGSPSTSFVPRLSTVSPSSLRLFNLCVSGTGPLPLSPSRLRHRDRNV